MKLNKVFRCCVASLLAAVLVCLQLATAAYACAAPSAAPSNVAMAAMPDCEGMSGMDPEQPQLCKAHCDRDKQTVNNAPAADLPSVAVLDWLLSRVVLWVAVPAADLLPAVVAAHAGPPDGSPPVYLALQVLRN